MKVEMAEMKQEMAEMKADIKSELKVLKVVFGPILISLLLAILGVGIKLVFS